MCVMDERVGKYKDAGKSKHEDQRGQGFELEILTAGDFFKCQTLVLRWSVDHPTSALLYKYESASAPDLLPTGSQSCLFCSVCSA